MPEGIWTRVQVTASLVCHTSGSCAVEPTQRPAGPAALFPGWTGSREALVQVNPSADVSAQPVSSGVLAATTVNSPEKAPSPVGLSPEKAGESMRVQCKPSGERHITVPCV